MRLSELRRAVDAEFGARGASLVEDLVLAPLGNRTPAQALAAGVDPREVWLALCDETDVPEPRRHGVGRLEPRR
ncbi:DUF3046 domain-containing protein [Microbacterium telephonicum]|uniref:DUF3046 family protein n=1 Tax=Microbacterium telephonicum TaxID=1714841 RepID=A0A498CMH8_9MICO|nr:DUF3046 domain-containing protein [Microbacterium telephonicum]RLK53001.1 hypothetical protein C7474_0963 [Microbacterium telephonicum]